MLTKGPPPPPPAGSRSALLVPSARQHGLKRLNWLKKGQHFITVDALLHSSTTVCTILLLFNNL